MKIFEITTKNALKEAIGEIASATEIYVDMDGVLADFFGEWAKLMQVDHFTDIDKQHDINDALQKIRDTDDFWLRLPILPEAKNLLNLIKKVKGEYSICTSPLADDPNSEKHKRTWVEKNLAFFPPKEVHVTHNKPQFATAKDGTPNILIDDYGVNINAWEAAGGIGFKYKDHKFERTAKDIKQHMDVNEGYKLKLERDEEIDVLHIVNTKTKKRIEVRGKKGYETDGYDPQDKLHQVLDKVGRSANVSELMNGNVVSINPKHPQGADAEKTAKDVLTTEALDNPYPFNLQGPDSSHNFVATAQTPNGLLRMDFEAIDYDDFGIDFAVGKSMGKTEAGDEFRVFATVVAMMNKWMSIVGIEHVESFDFGANKGEHASDGRAKLYTRFANRLASQLGWKLEQTTTQDRNTAFFKLTNPKPIPRDDSHWDDLEDNPDLEENFADGKKPGRKGLSQRVGIPKNATIAQLEKAAKADGEKGRMARWQLNMRRGKNK